MKKAVFIVLLIVLLAIIGTEVYILFFYGQQTGGIPAPSGPVSLSPTMTMPPVPTEVPATPEPTLVPTTPEPVASAVPATPTAAPTAAPTAPPAATPTPTPSPSPSPTPTPTPTPDTQGSAGNGGTTPNFAPGEGAVSSDTGTSLNLTASWRTEDLGNGTARLYVTGTVRSFSLNVISTTADISFGGSSNHVSCSSISVGDTTSAVYSSLFSTYLDVPVGTSGTLTVSWNYKGSYSGVSLPVITASGNITV